MVAQRRLSSRPDSPPRIAHTVSKLHRHGSTSPQSPTYSMKLSGHSRRLGWYRQVRRSRARLASLDIVRMQRTGRSAMTSLPHLITQGSPRRQAPPASADHASRLRHSAPWGIARQNPAAASVSLLDVHQQPRRRVTQQPLCALYWSACAPRCQHDAHRNSAWWSSSRLASGTRGNCARTCPRCAFWRR